MIYKYKTFEEAEVHLSKLLPQDQMKVRSRIWDLAEGLHGEKHVQKGMLKFKTIEEANSHRESESWQSE